MKKVLFLIAVSIMMHCSVKAQAIQTYFICDTCECPASIDSGQALYIQVNKDSAVTGICFYSKGHYQQSAFSYLVGPQGLDGTSGLLNASTVPMYANDSIAGAAGLKPNEFYKSVVGTDCFIKAKQ